MISYLLMHGRLTTNSDVVALDVHPLDVTDDIVSSD